MIPRSGYFEFFFPLRYVPPRRKPATALSGERYRLPDHCSFEHRKRFAEVLAGWNERGLHFRVHVSGRRRPVQVDADRFWRLDCFEVWIDTRGDRSVRQATRFCHHFWCLPISSRRVPTPKAGQADIRGARENAPRCDPDLLQAAAHVRADGYELLFTVSAGALTGFDPAESSTIGLAYHVSDVDFGAQAFPYPKDVPLERNPSLWAAVELTR